MITFLITIHISVCIFLVIIVLLQHGKGADVGATFGGGSQTVFGARGAATFLSKLTAGAAITFMISSLALAFLSARESSKSVFLKTESQKQETSTQKSDTSTASPNETPNNNVSTEQTQTPAIPK